MEKKKEEVKKITRKVYKTPEVKKHETLKDITLLSFDPAEG